MNDQELEELISHCPVLYHMAERGSWPSIRDRGSRGSPHDLRGANDEDMRAAANATRGCLVTGARMVECGCTTRSLRSPQCRRDGPRTGTGTGTEPGGGPVGEDYDTTKEAAGMNN